MAILRTAHSKLKQSQQPLLTPSAYARELGIPQNEIELNLHYLVGDSFLGNTVDTMTGGMVIFNLGSILPKGMDAVERGFVSQKPQPSSPTIHVEGDVIDSQLALGSGINQSQSTTIGSFQEAYSYLERNLAQGQAEELISLLKTLEAELGSDNVKPSNLKRLRDLAASYGPVVLPVVDFVLRAVGAKS